MTPLFPYIYLLFFLVNLVILVSSLDDLFIDVYFWLRTAIRRVTVRQRHPRFDLAQLHLKAEAPFAIMVPAWKEFSVIARMLETAQAGLEYQDYMIFVGTYANDKETEAEVDRIARRYRRVRRVQVPHAGPTCKADCLNWILGAALAEEAVTGRPFAGFVLHDAEDVIHPLELKVFNYFIGRKDLIQLPVLSLEQDKGSWVGGTYQDDFAESHSKEMLVRESITGLVPCAGTGVCYSHRAVASLSATTGGAPFNTGSLTEDYDFSFRLKQLGMSQMFLQLPLSFRSTVKAGTGQRSVERFSFIGVRENFPATFRTAFRQRSRWILGISLQGWEAFGWRGDLRSKYFMFRDRKGLFTSLVNIVGYLLFLGLLGLRFGSGQALSWPAFSAALGLDGVLLTIMQVNGILMVNRVVQRFLFVGRLYGPGHGLLAIPRIVVNNAINFAAAVRAWRLFIVHRVTGRPLAWDKTAHVFPTSEELQPFNRKLGEILLEWHLMDTRSLEIALQEQKARKLVLGRILLELNLVSEDALADAIAFQAKLPRSYLNLDSLARTQSLAPRSLMLRHGLVPLGLGEQDELLLGTAVPASEEAVATLTRHLTGRPQFFIISASDLAQGLAYLAVGGAVARPLDARERHLLEDYLIQRILGDPAGPRSPSFPILEDPERFRAFLAGRPLAPVAATGPLAASNAFFPAD